MKKYILLILVIGLTGCWQSHTYNVRYIVTFNNGDRQTFSENWDLNFKPDGMYLYTDKGSSTCAKICAGCAPNACDVRTVETLSITEIK